MAEIYVKDVPWKVVYNSKKLKQSKCLTVGNWLNKPGAAWSPSIKTTPRTAQRPWEPFTTYS